MTDFERGKQSLFAWSMGSDDLMKHACFCALRDYTYDRKERRAEREAELEKGRAARAEWGLA